MSKKKFATTCMLLHSYAFSLVGLFNNATRRHTKAKPANQYER